MRKRQSKFEDKKSEQGKRQRTPTPFVELLQQHLDALGWEQKDLVEAVNDSISRTQVSAWLGQGERHVSETDINWIAYALAKEHEKRKRNGGSSKGMSELGGFLNELLAAAGYSMKTSSDQDIVWNDLADKKILKVGWSPMPRLAETGPSGFTVDLTTHIAHLIGMKDIEWTKCKWSDLIPKLIRREIHLIAPFLQLPSRMLQISFSKMIPGVVLGINGILHKDHIRKVSRSGKECAKQEDVDFSKTVLNYLEGGIGETLCTVLAPEAPTESYNTDLAQARADLVKNPTENGRVRILVSDQLNCRSHAIGPARLLLPNGSLARLPLAFGIHPQEQKLSALINSCIEILSANGDINSLKDKYDLDRHLKAAPDR